MRFDLNRLTDWTRWPFYLFYAPIALAWPWYYLRSRSLWFFSAANPTITFGGYEGESKSELYRQLPAHLLPRSVFIKPQIPFADVLQQVQQHGIPFPFVVKPDVGMKGILFRKIETTQQLEAYHKAMPVDYIIQEFLDHPLEVSVFYYRKPGEDNGRITAVIAKELLAVIGNGKASLGGLVCQHPDAKSLKSKFEKEYEKEWVRVLAAGEIMYLSHIANLVNGARFKNLAHVIDEKLVIVFDAISHNNSFYYGRYDIKCQQVDDLRLGTGFYILEFNGAGSTPNHIYTSTYSLLQAYKELLLHWRLLYEASAINHKRGYRYWGFWKGYHFLKRSNTYFKMLKKLDAQLVLK